MVAKPVDSANASPPTVLFVDDEPLSQKYFKAAISKYANVLTAGDVASARKILSVSGAEISVVISDERMPQESGILLLSEVRAAYPGTVRILTSAYADAENLQQAINDAAISRFVPKPWNLDHLCEVIGEALQADRAKACGRPPSRGPDAAACMAVLAKDLDEPLRSIEANATLLMALSAQSTVGMIDGPGSSTAAWSLQHRLGRISAAAGRVESEAQHCQWVAQSMTVLGTDTVDLTGYEPFSLADIVQDVMDRHFRSPELKNRLSLTVGRDFLCRGPREFLETALVNLLLGACQGDDKGAERADIRIEISDNPQFNQLRISTRGALRGFESDDASVSFEQVADAVNVKVAALFGGQILRASDRMAGTITVSLLFPKFDSVGMTPHKGTR